MKAASPHVRPGGRHGLRRGRVQIRQGLRGRSGGAPGAHGFSGTKKRAARSPRSPASFNR
jgi:hypothetical protein